MLSILNIAVHEGVKILFSVLMGVAVVGAYQLAVRLLELGSSLSQSLIGPLMPAFANLFAGDEKERGKRLFNQSSKAIAIFGALSLAFIGLFADQALIAWTGEAFPRAAWTIRILATVEFLTLLTGVSSASLRARGIVGPELNFSFVSIASLLLCIYPLYRHAEYQGIIFSLWISRAVFSVGFLTYFFRREGGSVVRYVREVVLRVVACSTIAFVVVDWLMARYEPALALGLDARWSAVAEMLIWSIPYLLLSTVGFWRIAFKAEERAMLSSFVASRMPGRTRSAQS